MTDQSDARINARLDRDLITKLSQLQHETGLTKTQIIRASIEAFYAATKAAARPANLLRDFIASGDADPTLSETYKAALVRGLTSKHGGARRIRREKPRIRRTGRR
jgi:predicted DNA-binding protein